MNWYIQAFKRYRDFIGRSNRKEYWMFALFNIIFSVLATVSDYLFGTFYIFYLPGVLSITYALIAALPTLAVSVRRLHDIGKSGWFLLIAIIPIIGAIVLIVLFSIEGSKAKNKYGINPK